VLMVKGLALIIYTVINHRVLATTVYLVKKRM
jgi:hypothetical protein